MHFHSNHESSPHQFDKQVRFEQDRLTNLISLLSEWILIDRNRCAQISHCDTYALTNHPLEQLVRSIQRRTRVISPFADGKVLPAHALLVKLLHDSRTGDMIVDDEAGSSEEPGSSERQGHARQASAGDSRKRAKAKGDQGSRERG